jgi:hypothetical protein
MLPGPVLLGLELVPAGFGLGILVGALDPVAGSVDRSLRRRYPPVAVGARWGLRMRTGHRREASMATNTTTVPAKLPNGVIVHVQAAGFGGEQDIAAHDYAFETATTAIEGVAEALAGTLKRVQPQKASVEFELDFSVEAGQLTALFVKGSGSGTLKITLEWANAKQASD